MPDDLTLFLPARMPVAGRPLTGMTVLAVEDSRFTCEAMRLLCLRSGARLRRADSLRAARRHLATYRPAIALVDVGLPDGSGTELIAELAGTAPRIPAIIATSGDPGAEAAVMAAGADAFLLKPLESLRAFQERIAAVLAANGHRAAPAARQDHVVAPDALALRDDLALAAEGLAAAGDGRTLGYLAGFLSGVARHAHDRPLEEAARRLALDHSAAQKAAVSGLVRERLRASAAF